MKAKFLFLLVALPLALAACDESETGRTAPAATRADAGGEQGGEHAEGDEQSEGDEHGEGGEEGHEEEGHVELTPEQIKAGEIGLAYGAMVVDRGLPDGDGLALVRRCRAAGVHTPCLILTARDALHDRVQGLDGGADDYLTKPFAMDELSERAAALLFTSVRT